MSLYITRQIRLLVSESQQGTNPIVSRGGDEEKVSAQTALAEATGSLIVVAPASTDVPLPMGSGIATGRLFYLEADQDITIKFGGTEAERAMSVKVPQSGKLARMFLDIEFTSVYVTNSGTSAANVVYAVIGS